MMEAIDNFDRPDGPTDEHDHYTQWLLDELAGDLILLLPTGEQPGASKFTDVAGGHDAQIKGTWTLGGTPIVWDGADRAVADGSTGYADVGDPSALDFTGSDGWTFAAWVTTKDTSQVHHLVSKYDGSVGYRWYHSGSGTPVLFIDDGADSNFIGAGTTLSASTTHHIAVTRTAGGDTQHYVDGVAERSESNDPVGDLTNATDFWIGQFSGGGSYWDGAISHMLVCNRPLTADEIARMHERGRI